MKKLLRSYALLLLAVPLLTLSACRVEDDKDVVVTLPPEYTVDLFEARAAADGKGTFGLWVESMGNYPCPGYGIEAQVEVRNDGIAITILGVSKPAPCAGDSAPAKQFLAIGNLADGTYAFSISLRDVIVNNGTLTVAGGRYALSMPAAQGVFIDNFILEPLPDGMIWGYAATPDESSQPVADNFLTDLKTLTVENGLAPGFYGYFTVSGTDNISLHKSIAPNGAYKQFARRLNATPDALKGLLQNYRDAAQQPLDIKCWTTEGEF